MDVKSIQETETKKGQETNIQGDKLHPSTGPQSIQEIKPEAGLEASTLHYGLGKS